MLPGPPPSSSISRSQRSKEERRLAEASYNFHLPCLPAKRMELRRQRHNRERERIEEDGAATTASVVCWSRFPSSAVVAGAVCFSLLSVSCLLLLLHHPQLLVGTGKAMTWSSSLSTADLRHGLWRSRASSLSSSTQQFDNFQDPPATARSRRDGGTSPRPRLHRHPPPVTRTSTATRRTLMFAAVPGSYPPRCTAKCGTCNPCKPVHVPVPPGRLVTTMEYYPEAWRCKCGNVLYMP